MAQFDDEDAAEEYIDGVWTHLQTNYCHVTLTSSVLIERLDGINLYDVDLETDSASLQSMYDTTAADIGDADLMLYFAYVGDGYASGGGIAYVAATCEASYYNKYKHSSNFFIEDTTHFSSYVTLPILC